MTGSLVYRMIRIVHISILLFALLAAAATALEQPIPASLESDESNPVDIDHDAWQAFLSDAVITNHPSGINRLDYSSISTAQASMLIRYIEQMRNIDPRNYSRSTQFAYWINLYNALTVNLILEHYPVDSIRDIKLSLFSVGPWASKVFHFAGLDISLDDIEHKILRPVWRDPRIHYALNCASIGCPNLQTHAFTTKNTQTLLETAAQQYINHPRGVSITNGELHLSSIYHWYKEDFGGDVDGIVNHLADYAEPPLLELLKQPFYRYDHGYDWSLNQP